MSETSQLLIDLTGIDDVSAVGGKAFNLSQLSRLGIATPAGGVIPDNVFQRHLIRAGVTAHVQQLLDRLDEISEAEIQTASAPIRQRIRNTDLEPELVRAVATAWQRWPSRLLAVRSSAVGEDTAQTSFAGQLDSFLNIDCDAALNSAIKATWSSLFSLRVLLYARHNNLNIGQMGVIVQPQVEARLSGVLFTREPTGRQGNAMLAEFAEGLGEQVVGGMVTPSRLRIERGDLALTVEYAADEFAALDKGTTGAIQNIARIGLKLETEYGLPQDIEWCIDTQGKPIIVQARPATLLAGAAQTKVHWSNANIAENFPDPVTPLLFSIVKPGYSAYFKNLGLGFGVSRQRIQAMAQPLENIVGLQGGRLYYNLTNIHRLLQMMPAGRRLVEFFNLFVGAAAIPAPPQLPLSAFARVLETMSIAGSIVRQYLFIEKRVRRFEVRVDKFADNTQPGKLSGKSAAALANELQKFLTIRLTQWNDAALADTAAMVCYGLLKAQLARGLSGSDHSAIHNNLLKGLPGLASAEPVTKLWALCQRIHADPVLKALFAAESPEEILKRLSDEDLAGFNAAFADYLEKWGFRSSGELMLTVPTPHEDPRPVLRLLQAYLRARAASPDSLTRIQRGEREVATAQVAAQLSPNRWARWVPLFSRASRFRILLAATQGAIRLRERARMKQALLYTRLRHIALQLGERLVERGVLECRDDIFFLAIQETLALAAGETLSGDLRALIQSRKDTMERFQTQQPPDRLVLSEDQLWAPGDQAPGISDTKQVPQTLRGSGACGGSASGAAAVVLDVSNADQVQAGQILVTRQTDPGWATVFFLVRGLVIERGGMLSHGAIIAREYGIPAVIGVPEATRLIRDGERVRVDGDQGLVELQRH